MKERIIRHKAKLIVLVLVIVFLSGVFIWGGSYPKSDAYTSMESPSAQIMTANPSEVPEGSAEHVSASETIPATENSGPSKTPEAAPIPETSSGSAVPATPKPKSESPSDSVHKGTDNTYETQEMVIDPETGKDQYMTDPVPEGKPLPVESENADITGTQLTCSLSVHCSAILDNMELLDKEKWELVPEDGVILKETAVTFYEGESVFNVLQREMKKAGIHMEYTNTPMYNAAYIEAINNLYEFDVGELSGWMYKVNSWFPNYGCSRYQLKDGDIIEWVYTCDLGKDVGGYYSTGS